MDASALQVLIVDDSPEVRLTVHRLLSRSSLGRYTVIEAERGDQALAICKTMPPDCVLLDYALPDMDGLAVLSAVRVFSNLPVVLLTGVGNEELAVEAFQQGVQDYLIKGMFTAERLHLTIQRAVESVRLTRERDHSLTLLTTILNTVPVGVAVLDHDLHLLQANPALATLLGHPIDTLISQGLSPLYPTLAETLAKRCAQLHDGKSFSDLELPMPAIGERGPCWLTISGTPIHDADMNDTCGLLTVRDITAHKQAETALKRAATRLQILSDASAAFAEAGIDEQAVLDLVARHTATSLEAGCVIRLRASDGPWLDVAAVYDPKPEIQVALQEIFGRVRIHIDDRYPAAAVLRSGQPLLTPMIDLNAARAAVAQELWPAFELVSPQSVIVAPLRARGQILGSIAFSRSISNQITFTEDDLTLAQDLTDRAALAIQNVRLYQDVQAAQRATAEALARLDALVSSAPVGITYLDQELRYQLINPMLAAINGQPPEAHLGRTIADILPQNAALMIESFMRQVLATGEPVHNIEVLNHPPAIGAAPRDWLISYFPVHGSNGAATGIGATVTDITERRRAELALRESEARHRMLFETMAQGVIYYDHEGLITAANPAAEQILGLSEQQMQGCSMFAPGWRVIHEDGTPFTEENHPTLVVLRSGQAVHNLVVGIAAPDQTDYRWLRIHTVSGLEPGEPGPVQVYTLFDDITERRRVQQALSIERQQLEAILQIMDEGVLAFRPDGTIVVINEMTRQFVGIAAQATITTVAEAIANQTVIPIELDGQPFEAANTPVARVLRGERFSNLEARVRTARLNDDDWLAFSGMPVFNPDGTLSLAVLTARNITQRKRDAAALEAHSESLSRINAELTRALRLKDEFLAMMSHELRTPLNAILGITEAMEETIYGPLTERQQQALAHISGSGRHLLSILSDILDLARIGAGAEQLEWGPIAVETLCQSVLQLIAGRAQQKGIRLLRTVTVGVEGLRADERRLTQILVNLLDNAVKFTPPGGTIGLEVSTNPAQEQISFTVWDTGIGIAPTDMERLFQPFTQVDAGLARAYEGIGLGLSLVRRLTELHGGSVQLESTPGEGSRFTIILPWSDADNTIARSPASGSLAILPSWQHPPRIVLADDEEITLGLYAELLTQLGCIVTTARTGVEALARVRDQQPDIVLLDIQMPELDGLTVIKQIRAEATLRAIPIVAVTALAMPGDRERCLDAGANAYLAKPVSLHNLIKTMADLLDRDEQRTET